MLLHTHTHTHTHTQKGVINTNALWWQYYLNWMINQSHEQYACKQRSAKRLIMDGLHVSVSKAALHNGKQSKLINFYC